VVLNVDFELSFYSILRIAIGDINTRYTHYLSSLNDFKSLIMAKNKVKAVEWIQQSFLSDELKEAYLELLEVRYQLFIAYCDTQY
jgi:hypothetical protein